MDTIMYSTGLQPCEYMRSLDEFMWLSQLTPMYLWSNSKLDSVHLVL